MAKEERNVRKASKRARYKGVKTKGRDKGKKIEKGKPKEGKEGGGEGNSNLNKHSQTGHRLCQIFAVFSQISIQL